MERNEARKVLDKAREREKEHLDEERQRNVYLPMSPVERDW
jgi:hypothetical protein